jgi:hypothetical protein
MAVDDFFLQSTNILTNKRGNFVQIKRGFVRMRQDLSLEKQTLFHCRSGRHVSAQAR